MFHSLYSLYPKAYYSEQSLVHAKSNSLFCCFDFTKSDYQHRLEPLRKTETILDILNQGHVIEGIDYMGVGMLKTQKGDSEATGEE